MTASKSDYSAVASSSCELQKAASAKDLKHLSEDIGVMLPESLVGFLRWRDGGMFANDRFIIYSAGKGVHPEETLVAANTGLPQKHPLLNIARDASYDFGFLKRDLRKKNPPVYVYLHDVDEVEKVAENLCDWLSWAQDIATEIDLKMAKW